MDETKPQININIDSEAVMFVAAAMVFAIVFVASMAVLAVEKIVGQHRPAENTPVKTAPVHPGGWPTR